MTETNKIIESLTDSQKKIIQKAAAPGSIILFNIKGMIEVIHENRSFDFIEMGFEDIQILQKKGLIISNNGHSKNVLKGEEFILSSLGKKVAVSLV